MTQLFHKNVTFEREAATRIFLIGSLVVIIVVAALGAYILIPRLNSNPETSPSPSPTLTVTPIVSPTLSPTPSVTVEPTTSPTSIPNPSITVSNSTNWAGYVVVSDLNNPQPVVTGVSASWIVPAVAPSTSDTFSAVWIGIGGSQLAQDQTLIQCGSQQDSVGGQPQYSCWYELLPQFSRTLMSIAASPGDHIQASIQLANAAASEWNVTIFDLTSGDSFSNFFTYPASKLSAEWIVERPELATGVFASLANFGTVMFTDCSTIIGGVNGGISNFPTSEVVMHSSDLVGKPSTKLTAVSGLSGDGSQFTVTYLASSG